MRTFRLWLGTASIASVVLVSLVAAPATAAPSTFTTFEFPSASSTVVASVGFLDGTEIGYFWSAARGDSVTQSFTGPDSITGIRLKLDVKENLLSNGAFVSWAIDVNGTTVGNIRVAEGSAGSRGMHFEFSSITGPTYTVTLRVTNEVPAGDGSITLVYAGARPHWLQLHSS